jgi:cell wall-associated NlpC family hydrolase
MKKHLTAPAAHLHRKALHQARRWVHRSAFLSALALAGVASHAAPDAGGAGDPVMRLLEQRGLLPVNSPPATGPLSAADGADKSLLGQVRSTASDLVVSAMNFIGVRYRRGGNSAAEGFDCSGFTRHVFENSIGLVLPRRAEEQAKAPGLLKINASDLRPGDLVFFNTLRATFSHVGIYIGDGKFIHAPRTGSEVRIEDMRESYWVKRFTGARRVPQINGNELNNNPAP